MAFDLAVPAAFFSVAGQLALPLARPRLIAIVVDERRIVGMVTAADLRQAVLRHRMRPDTTAGEIAGLARAMTLKNALAGLPEA